eukprot:TRINITY_DN1589_c0_g2_i2.p1 TRINITY_DN1589_c0_g2~~TRINITY_DN1589_c0_g2_i2.p1  ORF type:complete len:101 (+),score=15.05 TRINITY_DN1589_c0_g2_i2:30-305(+)
MSIKNMGVSALSRIVQTKNFPFSLTPSSPLPPNGFLSNHFDSALPSPSFFFFSFFLCVIDGVNKREECIFTDKRHKIEPKEQKPKRRKEEG